MPQKRATRELKVAIIGGTGSLGKGLAIRLSKAHEVFVGSRDKAKAIRVTGELQSKVSRSFTGGSNEEVASACDIGVLAIPSSSQFDFLQSLKVPLAGKLVVSPIVPMRKEGGVMQYSNSGKSAAEEVADVLKESRVVAAFHNLPAATLSDDGRRVDFDVLVACDNQGDYVEMAELIRSVEGLRPLHVGPLVMSRVVEGVTPLLLNAAKLNGLRRLSVKFVE